MTIYATQLPQSWRTARSWNAFQLWRSRQPWPSFNTLLVELNFIRSGYQLQKITSTSTTCFISNFFFSLLFFRRIWSKAGSQNSLVVINRAFHHCDRTLASLDLNTALTRRFSDSGTPVSSLIKIGYLLKKCVVSVVSILFHLSLRESGLSCKSTRVKLPPQEDHIQNLTFVWANKEIVGCMRFI